MTPKQEKQPIKSDNIAPTETPKDKRLKNLKKPWKPGQSGNPKGLPKGRKNFKTLFNEAIRKIAEEKKLPIDDPEREMVVKAVVEALKGNYQYYRDIMDRNYGRPSEKDDEGKNIVPTINIIQYGNHDKPNNKENDVCPTKTQE